MTTFLSVGMPESKLIKRKVNQKNQIKTQIK